MLKKSSTKFHECYVVLSGQTDNSDWTNSQCRNSFSYKTTRPITHLHFKTQYAVSGAYSYAT